MNSHKLIVLVFFFIQIQEELSSENVSVGGDKDKGNSTDDNEDDDLTSLSWLQNKNLLKG